MRSLYGLIDKGAWAHGRKIPTGAGGDLEYFGLGVLASDPALRPLLDANGAAVLRIDADPFAKTAAVTQDGTSLAITGTTASALAALASGMRGGGYAHPPQRESVTIALRRDPAPASERAAAPGVRHAVAIRAVADACGLLTGNGWHDMAKAITAQAADTWRDLAPPERTL